MTIYEIDEQITSLIDEETGEIKDFEAFDALQMERNDKIDNMAAWVVDLKAQAKGIAEQVKVLQERKKAAENKAESLKNYLNIILDGQKFTSPRCSVSFKKTQAVEVDDDFMVWALEHADHYLRYSEPSVDKVAIKAAIKNGEKFEHAKLVDNISVVIK